MVTTEAPRIVRYEPAGALREVFTAHDPEILVEGPAGCVAGETLFLDPVTGTSRPIKELAELGIAPIVQTAGGPIQAEVPFLKGHKPLFRITLSGGASILATDDHLLLTARGFVPVGLLQIGEPLPSCEPIPLGSIEAHVQPTSFADAERLRQTGVSWTSRYWPGRRQYDQPLRLAVSSAPGVAPLGDDAHERSRDDWMPGVQVSRSGHTLQVSRRSDHPAKLDCWAQFGETYGAESLLLREMSSDDAYWFSGVGPSRTETTLPASMLESLVRDYASAPSFESSSAYYMGQWDTVQTLEYVRTDDYYDLHVPGAEHYFAQGMWHHNTGKTYAICQLIHLLCLKHPGVRILMARKTLTALTSTALVTFREKVLTPDDPVAFFGGSKSEPASFRYDNGSRIVVGGLDQASKILSSEYDLAYINEATELTEEDWETLTTRLRNGVLRYPRLIGDCNPSYDRHFLLQRCNRGQTKRIRSRHADNPTITEEYLASLASLTGTRHERLFLGEWVGMENAIYSAALKPEMFTELPERIGWTGRGAQGMDFGRIHYSTVVAGTEAHDGRLWIRECWTGHNDKQAIVGASQRQQTRYNIPPRHGVTDPLQDWAAQDLGFKIAKSGAGSRKGRIQRVLSLLENDAIRFDRDGEGMQDLWDELHMYRYEVKETDTSIEDVVVRKDDDRVAGLEYLVECWMLPRIEFGYSEPRKAAAPLAQRASTLI